MSPRYLSKEGLEHLKVELEELKTTRRTEIAELLKRAKEFGDLSENAEYAEARETQAQVEQRIAELEALVKYAVVIEKGAGIGGIAVVGSTVTLRQEKTKKEVKYTIVGSNEADPANGMISNESPLGKAFLGHKEGDVVTIKTPGGSTAYEIVRVA
jgi:transcription elongation factor GreA